MQKNRVGFRLTSLLCFNYRMRIWSVQSSNVSYTIYKNSVTEFVRVFVCMYTCFEQIVSASTFYTTDTMSMKTKIFQGVHSDRHLSLNLETSSADSYRSNLIRLGHTAKTVLVKQNKTKTHTLNSLDSPFICTSSMQTSSSGTISTKCFG